jgi:predicted  nucleic acid-binding Zn-ribbon protein
MSYQEKKKLELEEKFKNLPEPIRLAMQAVEKLVTNPRKFAELTDELTVLEQEIKELETRKEDLDKRKSAVEKEIEKLKSIDEQMHNFKESIVEAR